MNSRKMVVGAVLVFVGLPMVLVLIAAVSFYVLNRTNGTIVSSGQKREYLLYVPRSYDRAKPTPLVISMHALALWPAAQMETSQWNKMADEHGFIAVYPSGTGVLPIWRMKPEADLMADVRFISELIDTDGPVDGESSRCRCAHRSKRTGSHNQRSSCDAAREKEI